MKEIIVPFVYRFVMMVEDQQIPFVLYSEYEMLVSQQPFLVTVLQNYHEAEPFVAVIQRTQEYTLEFVKEILN